MILLDTNVLYLLARIEECKKYDIAKVESFVDQHTCSCAKCSFFELLNSNRSLDEKMKVLKYMKDHKIRVSTDPEIMKDLNPMWQQLVKDENYYNQLKKIYGKHIYPEVINSILFFVLCYPYICLTLYLDNANKSDFEGRVYFRKKAMLIQKEVDRHIKSIIKTSCMKTLEGDKTFAKNMKESWTNLIANIMSYYYQLIAFAKELLDNKANNFYYRIVRKFRSIKNAILRDSLSSSIEYDQECLSILKVMLDSQENDGTKKTTEKTIVKDALFAMARDPSCFPSENMQNSFEEIWLQRKLESLLLNCGKIDKNDFMDYIILQEAYYCKNVRTLLTFDDKIIKIMNAVKDSDLFQNSVKTITSFKIEAI